MKKSKHIAFFIAFPIAFILITLIIIFIMDLTNGPLWCFILEMIALAIFAGINIWFLNKKIWMRLLTWVGLIAVTVVIFAFDKPSTERKSAAFYANPTLSEVLELSGGKVQGVLNKDQDVQIYAGIPYAKAERWKLPQENTWEGTIDGSYFGPKSMQPTSNAITNTLVDMYSEKGWHPDYNMYPNEPRSEDGLYLNIWRPNNSETNLPIMVYIHGGSLTTGASSYDDYNGESLAKLGIVFITIQYRLGVFGYFAHPDLKEESLLENGIATTGNYGLLDQIFALKWIKNNANNFGGNANNITIAGESAGSSSVSALCTSPLASGLFKRAIGESSSLAIKVAPHTYRSEEKAYEVSSNILKEFNCKTIEEIRKIPAEKLTETQYKNSEMMKDGYALPKDPYQVYLDNENNEEALLNGYNVMESDAFVVPTFLFDPTNKSNIKDRLVAYFNQETADKIMTLYKDAIEKDAFTAFNEIITVYWFIMPHHSWSNLARESGVNVYRYQFTKENGFHSTYHAGELIYAYGNLYKSPRQFAYNDSDYALSKVMTQYWVNFAKTGNPNGENLPTWNMYQSSTDKVMELGSNVGPINDKYLALYDILDEYLDTLS